MTKLVILIFRDMTRLYTHKHTNIYVHACIWFWSINYNIT